MKTAETHPDDPINRYIWEIGYICNDVNRDNQTTTGVTIDPTHVLTCHHAMSRYTTKISAGLVTSSRHPHLLVPEYGRTDLDLLLLRIATAEEDFPFKLLSENEALSVDDPLLVVGNDNSVLGTQSDMFVLHMCESIDPSTFRDRHVYEYRKSDFMNTRHHILAGDTYQGDDVGMHPNLPLIYTRPFTDSRGRSGAPVFRPDDTIVGLYIGGADNAPGVSVHVSALKMFLEEAAIARNMP